MSAYRTKGKKAPPTSENNSSRHILVNRQTRRNLRVNYQFDFGFDRTIDRKYAHHHCDDEAHHVDQDDRNVRVALSICLERHIVPELIRQNLQE